MLIWLIVAVLWRFSSLAALISWTLAPLMVYFFAKGFFYPMAVMSILLIIRHRENIKKLLSGTESRIGGDKTADE